jgi:tRNA(fMet)-specific endonuclease VapC
MDLLIAATALQYDVTLLSNNRRHFDRIDGLRIESI